MKKHGFMGLLLCMVWYLQYSFLHSLFMRHMDKTETIPLQILRHILV